MHRQRKQFFDTRMTFLSGRSLIGICFSSTNKGDGRRSCFQNKLEVDVFIAPKIDIFWTCNGSQGIADDCFGPRNTLSITSGRFRFSDHALRARVRGSGEKVKRWQTRTKAEQGPSRRRGRELIVRDKSERVGVPSKRCNCYDY